MDMFSKTGQFPKKHHRCISLETGQTMTKKSYPKTPLDLPRFFPRRYSTPELAMRKHALKHLRDGGDEQPISNKSCQTDILGLDKYLQRSPPADVQAPQDSVGRSAAALRAYRKPSKKPKVRSVGVHCERRRSTFAAFKGCQKFKHVYKRKISLPQPSSTTCTSTDDGRQDSGMLPKLRLDRTETTERPTAAKTGPAVKLPRISTKDATKPDTDRGDDGGGCGGAGARGTRLAKLSRPQSTGSGGSSSGDRKLAYFRANSAPKIDSRYYTLIAKPPPPPPPPREQQSTAGSSDTADTTLDMSFVRHLHLQQQPDDATSATTTTTAAAATTTVDTSSGTRTVSTSTTFAEPVFPIVFSCESVLRHPLDGGYVSHTESHRFSVHYVPAENVARAVDTADTDDGSRSSSLVFRSAGACQNERCLTGDSSVSVVTVCGEPDSATTVSRYAPSTSTSKSTSTVDKAVERRLVVERLLHDAGAVAVRGGTAAVDDHDDDSGSPSDRVENSDDAAVVQRTAVDGKCRPPEDAGRTGGSHYVLGKGDAVHGFGKAVPPAGANKTIDTFGGDGAEAVAALESHAHEDDMPLLRSDERNYERLTQNHRIIDSGRTVSNQSPIFDDTAGTRPAGTDERRRIDPKPEVRVNDEHATESGHLPRTDVGSCTKQSADADSTKQSADADDSTDDDEPTTRPFDDNNYLTVPVDRSAENSPVIMASYGRNKQHGESVGKHGMTERAGRGEPTDKRHYEQTAASCKRNIPKRLDDDVSRKREDERAARAAVHEDRTRSQATAAARSNAVHQLQHRGESTEHQDGCRRLTDSSQPRTGKTVSEHAASNRHTVPSGTRANEFGGKHVVGAGRSDADSRAPVVAAERRAAADAHQREDDTNACHRCTHKSQSHGKNEPKHYGGDSGGHYGSSEKCAEPEDHHGQHSSSHYGGGNTQFSKPKRRLESVDECAESKESNYVGGYLFGDSFYKKQPQKRDPATDRSHGSTTARPKYEYYGDDSKKVNFSSKPDGHHYGYYEDYAPKTRHSPRDEDCTVFADSKGRAAEHASYYSQLGQTSYGGGGGDDKNTDSDESLTDSLEDGKCEVGTSVSYFLALNGQRSAVTFTLKMPNTLQSRLNRRQRMLKKHLHVSTTVRKTSVRVRTRHKGCQTLWTEEKGVQVQRGSTANATRKSVADDRKVLETLLAGLERHHVSENQIRVVGGQKMVSEGNQTDKVPEPPTDRHTQTQATRRDVAAGPGTPENHNRVQSHAVKKFSSDNALMVGVVRQNKYKGKEALDGTKNDQLLTLSKGWINFYTLRADSTDTADAQEMNANDDEVKNDDDNQQYTVHVQAIPEPMTLPVVHVPARNTLQVPKTCSTTKHLPRLVQTESNNNHHCSSHLATDNGWCVSVDGPNNMHMKVSLLPDKPDIKTSEHFDLNEENKLEARRLALQRKSNYMRKPYRNIKRTQSTPRDMFSADVSRTESALSAESKYIETIDTQLLIHKARRRLSQEWDTRIQNGGVTESVQLVVTGDSVSSRTSQHYATKGHQHCSFRRQSRRI